MTAAGDAGSWSSSQATWDACTRVLLSQSWTTSPCPSEECFLWWKGDWWQVYDRSKIQDLMNVIGFKRRGCDWSKPNIPDWPKQIAVIGLNTMSFISRLPTHVMVPHVADTAGKSCVLQAQSVCKCCLASRGWVMVRMVLESHLPRVKYQQLIQ